MNGSTLDIRVSPGEAGRGSKEAWVAGLGAGSLAEDHSPCKSLALALGEGGALSTGNAAPKAEASLQSTVEEIKQLLQYMISCNFCLFTLSF